MVDKVDIGEAVDIEHVLGFVEDNSQQLPGRSLSRPLTLRTPWTSRSS